MSAGFPARPGPRPSCYRHLGNEPEDGGSLCLPPLLLSDNLSKLQFKNNEKKHCPNLSPSKSVFFSTSQISIDSWAENSTAICRGQMEVWGYSCQAIPAHTIYTALTLCWAELGRGQGGQHPVVSRAQVNVIVNGEKRERQEEGGRGLLWAPSHRNQ